jgi:hypothetical protein
MEGNWRGGESAESIIVVDKVTYLGIVLESVGGWRMQKTSAKAVIPST